MKRITSPALRLLLWLSTTLLLTIAAVSLWALLPDRTSVASLKWLQLLQTLCAFVLPPLILAVCATEKPMAWLHLTTGMRWQTALFAVLTMLMAVPAINLLSHLNQQLTLPAAWQPIEAWMQQQEEAANRLTEQFLQVDSIRGLLLNLGLMALLPAIGEELTFRGVLQNLLAPNACRTPAKGCPNGRTHIAIWVTAAIFSFVHFQFYGFVPRMLMGAMFGYMLVYTGSLWVPMLMHFTNNATAVLSYYIATRQGLDPDSLDILGTGSTLQLGILSLLLVPTLIVLFARSTTKAKTAPTETM